MYDIFFASKHARNKLAYEVFVQQYPSARWLPNVKTLSLAVAAASPLCNTNMYWLITDDVTLDPSLDLSWKAETRDRPYPHIWPTVDAHANRCDEFAGVYLIPKRYKLTDADMHTGFLSASKQMQGATQILKHYDSFTAESMSDIAQACTHAAAHCRTEMHWIIMDDAIVLPDMDLGWRPPVWDRSYVHVWKSSDADGNELDHHTGIYLVPGDYEPSSEEVQQQSLHALKTVDTIASSMRPYDIFYISYQEPDAEANFDLLRQRFSRAQHVSGIKGIHNAHIKCAELSKTKMFWTVDADTIVDASFDFTYRPPDYDQQYLHLWHSRNPVNDLSYGWGAVKLWPTKLVREFKSNWLDFTTTVGNIKIIPHVVATTRYNCDALSSWRSGFREAVKLCHNIAKGDHAESLERLIVWLNVENPVPWAHESTQGARAGVVFYLDCKRKNEVRSTKNINDFDWLIDRYNNQTMEYDAIEKSDLLESLRD
jgi:hypothetical protein